MKDSKKKVEIFKDIFFLAWSIANFADTQEFVYFLASL